jgi:hypothetical protein
MSPRSPRDGVELHRRERLGYVVLQHIHTFTPDAAAALQPELIANSLVMTIEETREILEMLADQGFIEWNGAAGAAVITAEGANYLLRQAGRRRSVRFRSILIPGLAPPKRPDNPPDRTHLDDPSAAPARRKEV